MTFTFIYLKFSRTSYLHHGSFLTQPHIYHAHARGNNKLLWVSPFKDTNDEMHICSQMLYKHLADRFIGHSVLHMEIYQTSSFRMYKEHPRP